MGIIRSRVSVGDLVLDESDNKKNDGGAKSKTFSVKASRGFSISLDVRGQTGEEAWIDVDKYLDDAQMASVKSVTIIHGKGTGALRNQLWKMLKSDKRVKSFRAGQYGEGDYGVTVVELK